MFMRAQFSSQIASATDFLVTILLVKLFGIYYVYATFTGSVCGGIVNCIINYKWTFKSKECKKRHVMVKYLLVWIGSILLNTWGIYFMTETISRRMENTSMPPLMPSSFTLMPMAAKNTGVSSRYPSGLYLDWMYVPLGVQATARPAA